MLVRIKPCYTFNTESLFDNWAKKYYEYSFDVRLVEKHGDTRYYPSGAVSCWQYFLQKELIFIKEKK